jgi:hypothetical protein
LLLFYFFLDNSIILGHLEEMLKGKLRVGGRNLLIKLPSDADEPQARELLQVNERSSCLKLRKLNFRNTKLRTQSHPAG